MWSWLAPLRGHFVSYKSGDFMWVVRKTYDSFGDEQPYLELATEGVDARVRFSVLLEYTETKQTKRFQFNTVKELNQIIDIYKPYGCVDMRMNGLHIIYLIPVDDLSLKFLEYVDKVEEFEASYAQVKAKGYAPIFNDTCYISSLDAHGTLLMCNIGSGEECAGTLLHIMCYYPVLYFDGAFYMHGWPDVELSFGGSQDMLGSTVSAYKVISKTPAAVDHFLTKARSMTYNPVKSHLGDKRTFDHLIAKRKFTQS